MPITVNRQNSASALTSDVTGRRVTAEWNMTGVLSKVRAEIEMRKRQVFVGAVYRDPDNSIPDSNLRCVSVSVTVKGTENSLTLGEYIIAAQYAPINVSAISPDTELEINGPAVWSTEDGIAARPTDTDRFGNPIWNAAYIPIEGQSIPDGVEYQVAEWIRSNQNYFEAVRMSRLYRSKTNSVDWKGANRREVFCHGIRPQALDKKAYSGGGLVKYTAKFEFRAGRKVSGNLYRAATTANGRFVSVNLNESVVPGFSVALLNQGTYELNPLYDKDSINPTRKCRYRPITTTDASGRQTPISSPVLLTPSGIYERDDSRRKAINILYELIDEVDFNSIIGI